MSTHPDLTWDQVSKMMKSNYNIEVTQRHCKERWRFYLDPSLKQNQNQWTDDEVQYIITMVDRYGPDVAVIADCMEGRTAISVRNCLTNQLRRSIRFVEQQMSKITTQPILNIQAKYLIKIGAILVNQSPQYIDRTQPLRLRLIDMWRFLQKNEKPIESELRQCYKQYESLVKEYLPDITPVQKVSKSDKKKLGELTKKQQKAKIVQNNRKRKEQLKRQNELMKAQEKQLRKLNEQKKKRQKRQKQLRKLQDNIGNIQFQKNNQVQDQKFQEKPVNNIFDQEEQK